MDNFLHSNAKLEKIGQGFCGTVWAESDGTVVIKRADGGPGRSLPNEHDIHTRIIAAVASRKDTEKGEQDKQGKSGIQIEYKVNIPSHLAFLEQASTLWPQILPRLPESFAPCQALVSERIMPMGLAVRELLSRRYCPSRRQALALARDKSNESCLLRPYLGRRRPERAGRPRHRFFSLRNFPLHVDQMEELGLPAEAYALAMADALAFLHWTAKVDAGDVEYVLAPPRRDEDGAPSIGVAPLSSEVLGDHNLWILDFDCCRPLEMNEEGMRRAAMCFWRNDPFYPRPGAKSADDRHMWRLFEERFLERSGFLLREESDQVQRLPAVLMQTIRDNRDTWTKGVTDN